MTKIMFTLKPPNGSYGGGAFFVKNLSRYLVQNNHRITYTLDRDIDILIIIDPRKSVYNRYSIDDIENYKKNINPNVKILHRVNECDPKREISINVEPLLIKTMKFANHVVFVSSWLRNYFIDKYIINSTDSDSTDSDSTEDWLSNKSSYILNGVDLSIFTGNQNKQNSCRDNIIDYPKIITRKPIKIVTHHWSNNYLKGFEIYNELDRLLGKEEYKELFSLTYIGNYNQKYTPKHIKLYPPTQGKELSNLLCDHDIYLTATQFEPGAMHYLEGAASGLPVIYRKNGGGAHEICSKFGEEFNDINDFFDILNKIMNNYDKYCNSIDYYFISAERFGKSYHNLICSKLNMDMDTAMATDMDTAMDTAMDPTNITYDNIVSLHQGGISNRIKSFCSTVRQSVKLNCDYKLVWEILDNYNKNTHILNCNFSRLFENNINIDYSDITENMLIYKTDKLFIGDDDNLPDQFNTFNSKCTVPFKCKDSRKKDIDYMYLKIPLHLRNEYISYFKILQPTKELQDKIDHFSNSFNSNTVSVHIRSWNRNGEHGRRSNLFQLDKFEKEMKSRLNTHPLTNFFLTSDSSQVIQHFKNMNYQSESPFYNIIQLYPRTTTLDNSRDFPEGIQEDLIELYLLSKNNSIIGSHFSTYTEVAWWLASCPEDITIL